MATVTGLTAARMLDIEATSIVDGSVDAAGNLTLTTHSGVEIAAGNIKGPTGAAGSSQLIAEKTATALPSTYPLGVSQFTYTVQGTWPTAFGTVFTFMISIARGFQIISEKSTNKIWFRNVGQDSWTPFYQIATTAYVDSAVAAVTAQFDVEPTANTIGQRDASGRLQSGDNPFWGTDVVNVNHLSTYVSGRIQGTELGSGVDLNTITAPGVYHQSSNVEAAAGTNYPVPYAGLLEVFNVPNFATGMYWQRYTLYMQYGPEVWSRSYYNGLWNAWYPDVRDTGWVAFTGFQNSFSNATSQPIPMAYRLIGKTVSFRGRIQTPSISANTTYVITNAIPTIVRPPSGTNNMNAIATTSGELGWSNVDPVGTLAIHLKSPFTSGTRVIELTGVKYLID